MHLETLPHFSLGATLVRLKPLCEPFGASEVKTKMGMLMLVAAQTWNTTCIPSHDRLWVSTHTTFLTLSFGQERSDLFLLVLFTFDDTHWDIGVCVSWRSFIMFIHLFMDCAIHWIHITFRWSFSRHFMSFSTFPTHSVQATDHTFSLSCHSYVCIPHKMFLHFRELLVTGFTPAFTP